MTTFTVTGDNNITVHATQDQAKAALVDGAQLFASQKELAKVTAEWPASRLVETWNGFAGTPGFDRLKPVKKFTDRKAAIRRIWQAIQVLANGAEPGAQNAPEAAAATSNPTPKKGATKVANAVTGAKPKAAKNAAGNKQAAMPREGSKKQIVLDLLRRKDGATMREVAEATGWQRHSIRGFISGTLGKRMGLAVESTKNQVGERNYRIPR